jgi:hypothetical protein
MLNPLSSGISLDGDIGAPLVDIRAGFLWTTETAHNEAGLVHASKAKSNRHLVMLACVYV